MSLRSLMADNQRVALLDAIPERGTMLEWGAGGTTQWLLERLKLLQRLTTVEHDREWAQRVASNCGTSPNWTILHRPATCEVGRNATHWEECPAGLRDYIDPADIGGFDVFLIDGVARGACLMNVLMSGKSGARVFLHDCGGDKRADWYGWAMAVGERRIAAANVIEPDSGEYPTPMWACVLR